jgi:hypothetical protein
MSAEIGEMLSVESVAGERRGLNWQGRPLRKAQTDRWGLKTLRSQVVNRRSTLEIRLLGLIGVDLRNSMV